MSMAAPDYLKSRSRQARLQHYAHMDRNDDFRSVASPRDNLLLRAGRALAGFEDAIRLDYAVYARGVTARGRIHEADFQVAMATRRSRRGTLFSGSRAYDRTDSLGNKGRDVVD
jgi:hypothetical protein